MDESNSDGTEVLALLRDGHHHWKLIRKELEVYNWNRLYKHFALAQSICGLEKILAGNTSIEKLQGFIRILLSLMLV